MAPFYRFEDLPDEILNPDLSKGHGQTIQGERIYFGRREQKAGTFTEPHFHPNEQFLYLLKGKLRVNIEDEEQVVGPGWIVHVPANVVHSTRPEGDEDAEYLYVKDTRGGLTGKAAGSSEP